jgi:broad specificity phosphatase PhoE
MRGVKQAVAASNWIEQNIGFEHFAIGFHSPYVRAIQTASHIKLPGEIWRENPFIRERDWGEMDFVPTPEQYEDFLRQRAIRNQHPVSWLPPNGENLMSVPDRLYWLFRTMTRHYSESSVLCVLHGDAMMACRIMHERVPLLEAQESIKQRDPRFHIPNCCIIQYTRINPFDPADIRYKLSWVRKIDPLNPPLDSTSIWEYFERKFYSCDELAARIKPYVDGFEDL